MATTKAQIRQWIDQGLRQGATHMLVVCDSFDHEDYPVYVSKTEQVRAVYDKYRLKSMQRVMEVYSLAKDIEQQLGEHRSFNFD